MSRPSLSKSKRPAGYTCSILIKSDSVLRPCSSVNWERTPNGLLKRMIKISPVYSSGEYASLFALPLEARYNDAVYTMKVLI